MNEELNHLLQSKIEPIKELVKPVEPVVHAPQPVSKPVTKPVPPIPTQKRIPKRPTEKIEKFHFPFGKPRPQVSVRLDYEKEILDLIINFSARLRLI